MKITDIIRQVIDIIDAAEQPQEPELVAVVTHAEIQAPDELDSLKKNAGLEYNNTPQEVIAPLTAAFPDGTDLHHGKNPADIRTNAPSMFPGFQAGVK